MIGLKVAESKIMYKSICFKKDFIHKWIYCPPFEMV
jgi:hypothetical protein